MRNDGHSRWAAQLEESLRLHSRLQAALPVRKAEEEEEGWQACWATIQQHERLAMEEEEVEEWRERKREVEAFGRMIQRERRVRERRERKRAEEEEQQQHAAEAAARGGGGAGGDGEAAGLAGGAGGGGGGAGAGGSGSAGAGRFLPALGGGRRRREGVRAEEAAKLHPLLRIGNGEQSTPM